MYFKIDRVLISSVLIFGLFVFPSHAALDQFDVSNSIVNLDEFMSGGPSKDGIPSLDEPQFVSAQDADFLKDDDIIVGLTIDGQAKAYPLRILNWHEIVNDHIADRPVAVTWCPLTKSAVIFDRRVDGATLEFGVSGLLYNSNVAMYDRQSQGLWSQLKMGGITGKFADHDLNMIPSVVTTWQAWHREHPSTRVLSIKTGHRRDYDHDPYAQYHKSSETMFPVGIPDQRLRSKSLVVGITINGTAKAYALEKIQQLKGPLQDRVNGVDIQIWPLGGSAVKILDKDRKVLPSVVTYWFAWKVFNKDTLVYVRDESMASSAP